MGRPRKFDPEKAVAAAMCLFWDRGYEGTSFDELVSTMGIGNSSLYTAFGSKERLYQLAIEAFVNGPSRYIGEALLGADDVKEAFSNMLDRVSREFTRPDRPAGCMISLAATHVGPAVSGVRTMMRDVRATLQETFAARLRKGVADGQLAADTDTDELASFFAVTFRGLAVLARDGHTQEDLHRVGRTALRLLPTPDDHGAKRSERRRFARQHSSDRRPRRRARSSS